MSDLRRAADKMLVVLAELKRVSVNCPYCLEDGWACTKRCKLDQAKKRLLAAVIAERQSQPRSHAER